MLETDRSIQIPIEHETTPLAAKRPISKSQLLIHPSAATTPPARGLPAVGKDDVGPIPGGFVDNCRLNS